MKYIETEYDVLHPAVARQSPPQSPQAPRSVTEIQSDIDREKVQELLRELWFAAGLHHCAGGIRLPGRPEPEVQELHRRLWTLLGKTLLGKDLQQQIELT